MIRIIVDRVLKEELDREGRVDPLLQEEFHEGDAIAQCPSCKSWMLWQSWQDLGGACACSYRPDTATRITVRPGNQPVFPGNIAAPTPQRVTRAPPRNPAGFIVAAIIGVIVLAIFALAQSNKIQPKATFLFEVCNRSSSTASIAVLHYSDEYSEWVAEGWWRANSGTCMTLGPFKKGAFYYYAQEYGGNAEWPGDFGSCVEYPGPFKNVVRARSCSPGEYKKFSQRTISEDKWTVNLRD